MRITVKRLLWQRWKRQPVCGVTQDVAGFAADELCDAQSVRARIKTA
jgi:hypothetical protein